MNSYRHTLFFSEKQNYGRDDDISPTEYKKITETINSYFEIYVEKNIERLLSSTDDKKMIADLLNTSKQTTKADFMTQLTKQYGTKPNNDEIIKIFIYYWRLANGKLQPQDELMSHFKKMNPCITVKEYNAIISKKIPEHTYTYLAKIKRGELRHSH